VSALAIGCIVFACVFGGALLGVWLRAALPQDHLSAESKDLVKVATGLLATMSALVLGLLVASAKGSYDTQNSELRQASASIILLDRGMAHYGPETKDARALLRRSVADAIDRVWPKSGYRSPQLDRVTGVEALYDTIQALSPQNEAQRALQGQALRIAIELGGTRWLLSAQRAGSIPMPFLVILVFWLVIIFVSFGLFAPPNATVITTLFVCALSLSGAIFTILELDRPFEGLVMISSEPLRDALARLGQ
jgi:hypothetical protein